MKYEIIKGSEKDFEGAPEWAALRTFTGGSYFFAEFHGAGARVLDIAQDDEFKATILFDPSTIDIIAERRPITEPVWDGEGLPPAGVECEINNSFDWITATVMFISGFHTVIQTKFGNEYVYDTRELKFRPTPIRSPEDAARDEAIEAMRDVGHTLPAAIRFTKEEMAALYDAGYRKLEGK